MTELDNAKNNIPLIEKYRPTKFSDIVLDSLNRKIFQKVLDKDYFPNLIFYGPPGTGKTTTIINLINSYQQKHNQVSKGTILHLNASDERGIDIIRNQIYQFVKTKNLFEMGIKFVILDEVDYMTKNAQQALKYLLQSSAQNVRFCLICNYISKIDESLKNEFIAIRFNQLPKKEIETFLKNIAINEGIILSDTAIDTIQKVYNSDIRSMINFIQLHQNMIKWENAIITDSICSHILELLTSENKEFTRFLKYMYDTSIQYNTDKRNILKYYFNYIVRNKKEYVTNDFLNTAEFIIHVSSDAGLEDILKFAFYHLHSTTSKTSNK
jgi:replication factor C subunit 3/5